MDELRTLTAFSALSQKTRLRAYRLLIKAGGNGLAAGDLANLLNVRQNTMSANLGVLLNSGLVFNRRDGRNIRYFADLNAMRTLLAFIMEDCCGGERERCRPVINEITSTCVEGKHV